MMKNDSEEGAPECRVIKLHAVALGIEAGRSGHIFTVDNRVVVAQP